MNYRDQYKFYKNRKICPWCKKRKAYKNRVKCLICLMDDRYQKAEKRRTNNNNDGIII